MKSMGVACARIDLAGAGMVNFLFSASIACCAQFYCATWVYVALISASPPRLAGVDKN
jgi:hypothetical protein